jgi:hypothetical protein
MTSQKMHVKKLAVAVLKIGHAALGEIEVVDAHSLSWKMPLRSELN